MLRVRDRVADALAVDAALLTLDAMLDEFGADSLDLVELVMELEEEFDVEIADDAAERIKTLRDAIRYIAAARRANDVNGSD
jgi:acyl carrier protein